jgi:hypothetical protein
VTVVAQQRWQRLGDVLARQADEIGGHGRVTFEVTFAEGMPVKADILERRPSCRLDHELPLALTPAARRAAIARATE